MTSHPWFLKPSQRLRPNKSASSRKMKDSRCSFSWTRTFYQAKMGYRLVLPTLIRLPTKEPRWRCAWILRKWFKRTKSSRWPSRSRSITPFSSIGSSYSNRKGNKRIILTITCKMANKFLNMWLRSPLNTRSCVRKPPTFWWSKKMRMMERRRWRWTFPIQNQMTTSKRKRCSQTRQALSMQLRMQLQWDQEDYYQTLLSW